MAAKAQRMTTGDLITGDWQLEREGLLVGDSTAYDLRNIAGLASSARVRSQDRELVLRNGAVPGSDFLSPRTVGLTFEIIGDDAGDLSTKLDALNAAFGPTQEETCLSFQIPGVAAGRKAQIEARLRRRDVPVNLEFSRGVARVLMDFVATDPLIYSANTKTETTTLSVPNTGIAFDIVGSLYFGGPGTAGGGFILENTGNYATSPTFKIHGPCLDPVIEHVASGSTLEFDIDIPDGQYLEIDVSARSITLGGTSSRYSKMVSGSRWFDLNPGANDIAFRSASETDALLEATWRDAWS